MFKSVKNSVMLIGFFACILHAATISGIITDSLTGKPIPNANVDLIVKKIPQTSTTGVDGSYSFENIPVGPLYYNVTANGYRGIHFQLVGEVVSETDTIVNNFQLCTEVYSKISGLIKSRSTGNPIANAKLSFYGSTNMYDTSITTGSNGSFSFDSVPTGEYGMDVEAGGYKDFDSTFEIIGTDPMTVEIKMDIEAYANIKGFVKGPSGNPVANAKVFLYGMSNSIDTFIVTDSDGSFSLEKVPTGEFAVDVDAEGYEKADTTFEITGTDPITLNIQLTAISSHNRIFASAAHNELLDIQLLAGGKLKYSNFAGAGQLTIISFNGKQLFKCSFDQGTSIVSLPTHLQSHNEAYIVRVITDKNTTLNRVILPLK